MEINILMKIIENLRNLRETQVNLPQIPQIFAENFIPFNY